MSTAVANRPAAAAIERVLIGGDLSALSEADRIVYYHQVCESLDLNPLTQPFRYLSLQGKLTLYATRACTEQLALNRKVALEFVSEEIRSGCYVYRVLARTPDGRTAPATGVVSVEGLKGEPLCNAFMKAETKACRRAVLRICGLGLLDETEVETIPDARTQPAQLPPPAEQEKPAKAAPRSQKPRPAPPPCPADGKALMSRLAEWDAGMTQAGRIDPGLLVEHVKLWAAAAHGKKGSVTEWSVEPEFWTELLKELEQFGKNYPAPGK